ncbi:hypothetical protein SpCBS45565_g00544 [Spizellomyces sp. 'palustris']|nr:hypothetical protein SpCBS45565_g00544 [Spizellomyces sp. 'palustris']
MTVIRDASHAGSWYSGSGKRLSSELDGWLAKVPTSVSDGSLSNFPLPITKCRAIIAPHAGYSYSGPAAAYAYKCVDVEPIKRVFVLGPSHHFYLDGCALSQCDEYETPLGNLKLDKDVIAKLKATGEFSLMSQQVDEDEHSIEMHLPYVYKIFEKKQEPYTIVPILVGAISAEKETKFGRLLASYLADPQNLFVVSSDFCHWGSRFSYTYQGSGNRDPPIYQCIETLDREGMEIIETIDPKSFTAYLKKTRNTICGRHPIGVLLNAAAVLINGQTEDEDISGKRKKQKSDDTDNIAERAANGNGTVKKAEIKFIHYAQSSKVTSNRDSSVSYASAYLYLDL